MNDQHPPTLLAIFAHPDDEAFSSGGTLAHYAARGVRVVVACATRGEAGKITDPGLTIEDLGRHREQELRRACEALGIDEPRFLDYHDSGREERTRHDDPRALMNTDPLDVEPKLLALIRELRPQVLITFDPHGGYGHIDHLVMHRAATAAFFSSGHLPGAPRRLFFTALPTEAVKAFVKMGMNIDPELYGVSEDTIAVTMDVRAYQQQKLAALQAHGSQVGPNSRMGQLPAEERAAMQERMIERESFSVGGTRGPIPSFPLRGLFDGLPGYEHLDAQVAETSLD